MKLKIDGFVLSIIAVVAAAYLFPYWAGSQSPIPIEQIATVGISLIFFFYGLKLSGKQIKSGLQNWKLHLLVQLSTFLLFPLLVLPFKPFIAAGHSQTIWLAFLFLAALPSTVSSSVVMVSIAKGNVPAAIFNASISGLIGIVVTPLWLEPFMPQTAANVSLFHIYMDLLTQILLPVLAGILLQGFLGRYARKYDHYLTLFDKAVILVIIYKSFGQSFEENIFSSVDVGDFALILGATVGIFFIMYFLTGYLADKAGFTLKDRTTAQYCGTKKSLVHGTIFAKILFPGSASIGIILLPVMLFHSIQIFIMSILATRRARRRQINKASGDSDTCTSPHT